MNFIWTLKWNLKCRVSGFAAVDSMVIYAPIDMLGIGIRQQEQSTNPQLLCWNVLAGSQTDILLMLVVSKLNFEHTIFPSFFLFEKIDHTLI